MASSSNSSNSFTSSTTTPQVDWNAIMASDYEAFEAACEGVSNFAIAAGHSGSDFAAAADHSGSELTWPGPSNLAVNIAGHSDVDTYAAVSDSDSINSALLGVTAGHSGDVHQFLGPGPSIPATTPQDIAGVEQFPLGEGAAGPFPAAGHSGDLFLGQEPITPTVGAVGHGGFDNFDILDDAAGHSGYFVDHAADEPQQLIFDTDARWLDWMAGTGDVVLDQEASWDAAAVMPPMDASLRQDSFVPPPAPQWQANWAAGPAPPACPDVPAGVGPPLTPATMTPATCIKDAVGGSGVKMAVNNPRVKKVKEPKPAPTPKQPRAPGAYKHPGQKKGLPQAGKAHQWNCTNPAAGCRADCPLLVDFPEVHAARAKKPLPKQLQEGCMLPPQYQRDLWRHVA